MKDNHNYTRAFTVYAALILLFFLTAAYSYFVLFSTQAMQTVITDSNTNPSLLFSLMVKPYPLWIIAAWVSFAINTKWVFSFNKNQQASSYLINFVTHLMWVFTGFLLHLVGLFSPFISTSYMIQ